MGIQIIITIQTAFEYEVHQSGLGMFRKLFVQGGDVMWWDIQQEAEGKIVPRLLLAKGDCSSFDDSSVYVISHGMGAKVAGLQPDIFASYLELFLKHAKCPEGAKLQKLCLIACNAGKLATNGAPPIYLGQIASALTYVSFGRIIAWNSWVTVYSFRHIANLCVKYRKEILQEAMKFIEKMSSEDYVALLSSGLVEDLKSVTTEQSQPNVVLHASFKIGYLKFLDEAPLEDLLALVGKKLVQGNQGPMGKRFSNTSSSPVGLRNVFNVSENRVIWRRALVYEMLRKKFGDIIAGVIAEYDAMWSYYPEKMKICLMDSKSAKALGYKNL